ncbi:MAG: sporulation protein YabP [Ruminococcaceae bacterium]|nr:sporulation protein YabP [Oscillospiraceae bacterium]MBQ3597942.1 YabP/YqfC family sporulation protein [Clostridia bacterium]MBR2915160.1 YabP/YqfC family sporulation protein [Clostridia bacterium]
MNEKIHSVTSTARDITLVTAVYDIISFDDTQVSLSLGEDTILSVTGTGLTLRRLSLETGEVDISGRIDAIVYLDSGAKQKKRRLFG